MIKNVRGKVEIIRMPAGEAPKWVRKEWVTAIVDVIQKTDKNGGQYIVRQKAALKALFKVSRRAWLWWKNHNFPQRAPTNCFGFKISNCRPVGTVTELPSGVRMYHGLLEVGVGAHDNGANQ